MVAYLSEQLSLEDPINTLEFSLSGEFTGRYISIDANVQGTESDARLVANLPSYCDTVFLAFARGPVRQIGLVLPNAASRDASPPGTDAPFPATSAIYLSRCCAIPSSSARTSAREISSD